MKFFAIRRVAIALTAVAGLILAATGCATRGDLVFVQATDPQLGMTDFKADAQRLELEISQINQSPAAFVLFCGDLVDQPSAQTLGKFAEILKGSRKPVYCVPGNHDNNDRLFRHFFGNDHQTFTAGKLAFVLLNSDIIKRNSEPACAWQNSWLKEQLQQYAEQKIPVVIVMHHALFVNAFNEAENYSNLSLPQRQELLALFKANGVIAVLHGHTHVTRITSHEGITFASAPTTSKNFDKQPYGYLLWRYNGNQLTATTVSLTAAKK